MYKQILLATTIISRSALGYPPTLLEDHIQPERPPSLTQAEFRDSDPNKLPQFLDGFHSSLKKIMKELAKSLYFIPQVFVDAFLSPNPHVEATAKVRYCSDNDLSEEERTFLKKRHPIIREALEKLTDKKIGDNIPKIGLCFSGGGFRSMILTLGFLRAAQETGLLDASMYVAGLSGSTWAIAPWIASRKSLEQYLRELSGKISAGLDHIDDPNELASLLRIIVSKLITKQYISAIDIYGAVLANTLLKDLGANRFYATLSQTHAHVAEGNYPLPLYTAVATTDGPYEWIEFTPFEAGNLACKSHIPVWAYGRKFRNCLSHNAPAEQTLGYLMGIFGSAFEASIEDILHRTTYNVANILSYLPGFLRDPVGDALHLILESPLGSFRLFPSIQPNFTYGCEQDLLFREVKELCLVDAGLDCNLPVPPLLHESRKLDIIVIYDGSSSLNSGYELQRAEEYARARGLKFPKIQYCDILTRLVSVFKDENDPETPVVIYFPRILNHEYNSSFNPDTCADEGYCNTFNFTYSHANISELSGLSAHAVKVTAEVVAATIADVIERKYSSA